MHIKRAVLSERSIVALWVHLELATPTRTYARLVMYGARCPSILLTTAIMHVHHYAVK